MNDDQRPQGDDIDLADAASYAISFTLTRRDQKKRSDADMEFIVARAIALGVARIVDSVALKALSAATPGTFSVAKAAARGLKVAELGAICGSSGAGAAFSADGAFRVAGVAAEMTDVTSQSFVGAFGRIGIAMEPEIRVVAKRTSIHGDLEITGFLTVEPLMPTGANDIWVVQ